MKTYTMDEHELAAMPSFDFETAYAVADYEGIAFRADRWETIPDEDTEWSGYEVPTGRIEAHIIGDDRTFDFDPDDMTPLDDEAYCGSCGQIGCPWH